MLARIERYGRAPFTVECDATFSESAQGGFKEATVQATFTPDQQERLLDAEVYLLGPDGPCWWGRVWDAGPQQIRCSGQGHLTHDPEAAIYVATDLTPWVETTRTDRNQNIGMSIDSALLRATFSSGTTYPASAFNWWMREIPRTNSARLTFSWTRPSETGYLYRILTGVRSGTPADGSWYNWTLRIAQSIATGSGTSGAAVIDLTNFGDFDAIALQVFVASSVTPGADAYMTFSNVALYGVPGIVTDSASPILLDLLDEIGQGQASTMTPTFPDLLTVTTGTLIAGTAADLAAVGGTDVHIDEVSGTPGFDARLRFPASAIPSSLTAYVRYQGSAAHLVDVQVYNGSTWDTLTGGRQPEDSSKNYRQWTGFTSAHVIGGTVTVRWYHTSGGNNAHELFIDAAWLNILGSGTASERSEWVETDTTALGHFTFSDADDLATKIARLVQSTGKLLRYEFRQIRGLWKPCPVYKSEPTVPLYKAVVDNQTVVANLQQASMDVLATNVRVRYSDADGRTTVVDVPVDCPQLEAVGVSRTVVVDADTTSEARAIAYGQAYGNIANNTVQGQVTVTGPINGVEPCYLRAGELIELRDPDLGTVTGRITEVSKRELGTATLTLGQTTDQASLVLKTIARNTRSRAIREPWRDFVYDRFRRFNK